jgi:hypothetical protein
MVMEKFNGDDDNNNDMIINGKPKIINVEVISFYF